MAKTQRLRNIKKQFWLSSFLLCVSVPLWFKTTVAQEKLSPETEAKIRAVLDSSPLKGAHIGLSILDLGTVKDAKSFPAQAPIGKPFRVLFEHDADKKFMPASNMKLFTAAIVLELLGKDKTFPTMAFTTGKPFLDEKGEKAIVDLVEGNVYLRGGGDPSLSTTGLQDLAKKLAAAGIREITGDVIADGHLIRAETTQGKYPFGWTIDDTLWYYGSPVSALAFNRNQVDVLIKASEQNGEQAVVSFEPPIDGFRINSRVISSPAPDADNVGLFWDREVGPDEDVLSVKGLVAVGSKTTEGIALPDPDKTAGLMFKRALQEAGIVVKGNVKTDRRLERAPTFLTVHESPPLHILFQRLLKNSDNLYAEMLLRSALLPRNNVGNVGMAKQAHDLLRSWLEKQGIDTSGLRFEDGSGLSRYNLLTPRATAELLAAINRMKDGDVIWNALPIAGTDGTLKKRMKSTPALGNVRAKSGTFSIASNLSGYVTTKNNRRLAVSIYMNFPRDTDAAQNAQDKIFAALAASH